MTVRQMMDVMERAYPMLPPREILIYINQALLEYVKRTRLIVPATMTTTMTSASEYKIADMDADIDSYVNSNEILFEVKEVYVGGRKIANTREDARNGIKVWGTDGRTISIFTKNADGTTTPSNDEGKILTVFCEIGSNQIDSDNATIPIPEEHHGGVLLGARVFASESAGDPQMAQYWAQRYEYAVREGIKTRNQGGMSGTINVVPYDY